MLNFLTTKNKATMIEAKQLRIGNWVNFDNRNWLINSVTKDFPYLETIEFGFGIVEYRNIEPIPLTPEILEKCGFDPTSKGFFKHPNWYNVSLKYIRGTYSLRFNFTDIVATNIDYVHQLQNLYFALTGEELTINL